MKTVPQQYLFITLQIIILYQYFTHTIVLFLCENYVYYISLEFLGVAWVILQIIFFVFV